MWLELQVVTMSFAQGNEITSLLWTCRALERACRFSGLQSPIACPLDNRNPDAAEALVVVVGEVIRNSLEGLHFQSPKTAKWTQTVSHTSFHTRNFWTWLQEQLHALSYISSASLNFRLMCKKCMADSPGFFLVERSILEPSFLVWMKIVQPRERFPDSNPFF